MASINDVVTIADIVFTKGIGILFIFAGISKIEFRKSFLLTLRMMTFLKRIPLWNDWGINFIASLVPFLEIILGTLLLVGLLTVYGVLALITLLLVFIFVSYVVLQQKIEISCSCFGNLSKGPLSIKTILRNVLIIMLLIPVFLIQHPAPFSIDRAISSGNMKILDWAPILLAPIVIIFIPVLYNKAHNILDNLDLPNSYIPKSRTTPTENRKGE